MQAEIKQKWIEDLRSGKYQQTQNCLKDSKGYCCLGVLAEGLGWKIVKDTESDSELEDDMLNSLEIDGKEVGYMPISQLFMDSHIAYSSLVKMNDTDNADFNQIADYIEKNL